MGGRLCTPTELEHGEGDGAECGYASIFKWSWADTPTAACAHSNQSLGMAGSGGGWFSFMPSAVNAYHEVQLRSEHPFHGDSFTILGVLDEHGDLMPGTPATMHFTGNGAMMRWNATQTRRAFVHVTSTASDARYTMAAVIPPHYTWRSVSSQTAGRVEVIELPIAQDAAVAVNLPFFFTFFGLEYQQIWVSSSGMVLFEPPLLGLPFNGVDSIHTAIIVAAGEYNLNHPAARVTKTQLSPTRLEVSWHAPLFDSDMFTDVAVALDANGSVSIRWDAIDLSGGGSLAHGLVALLTFENSGSLADLTTVRDSSGFSSGAHLIANAGGSVALFDPRNAVAETQLCHQAEQPVGVEAAPRQCTAGILGNLRVSVDNGYRAFLNGAMIGEGSDWTTTGSHDFTVPQGAAVVVGIDAVDSGGTGALLVQIRVGPDLFVSDRFWKCQSAASEQPLPWGSTDTHMEHPEPHGWKLPGFNDLIWEPAVRWPSNVTSCNGCDNPWSRYGPIKGINPDISQSAQWIWTADARSDDDVLCRLEFSPSITAEAPSDHLPVGDALMLVDDSYLQLESMTLGGAVAVSAWVRGGARWGIEGFTLFSSFQSDTCGNTDACRNAVGQTLSSYGWFAVGSGMSGDGSNDLWSANAVYTEMTAGSFWQGAHDDWMMVTFSVSGQQASAYVSGQLCGVGVMTSGLPRMQRHNNYIGAAHHAPYEPKAGGISMTIADFRLYDRSLAANEVAALFDDPASECCTTAGLKDTYGVADLDLSEQVMSTFAPSAVSITPSTESLASDGHDDIPDCTSRSDDDGDTGREFDICSEFITLSDCNGVITDGALRLLAFAW
jgi:hypothetical protein